MTKEDIRNAIIVFGADRDEQLVHLRRLGDDALLGEIAHQCLQRRAVGLDAVGPGIRAEQRARLPAQVVAPRNREARSVAMRDCRSPATPLASQTTAEAIGRAQIASVSSRRCAPGGSDPSRAANMSANVGGGPDRGLRTPA